MTKKLKKSLALILSILMLMSVVPFGASYATVYEEGYYKYDRVYTGGKNEITVLKYSGNETDIVIPETFSSYPVVAIGNEDNQPFSRNTTIETVVIPDTVKSIATAAFYGCLKLTTITIGVNLTSIGSKVFSSCSSLNTVNYKGTKAQWENLIASAGSNNNAILESENPNLIINYNYGYDCAVNGHKEATFVESKTATCDEEGNISYWCCGVCEAKFSDETLTTKVTEADLVIPAIHKTLQKTVATEANCTTPGNHAYWYCATCDTYFADAKATTEYDETNSYIIPTNENHSYGEWNYVSDGRHERVCANNPEHIERFGCADTIEDKDCNCDLCGAFVAHTFSEATCVAGEVCTVCGAEGAGINSKAHNLVKKDASDNTCTTDGNRVYWYCTLCEKYYKDENANEEYTENEWVIPAAHKAIYVGGKEPTCTKDGIKTHYQCSVCKLTFSDRAATKPFDPTKPATGHKTTKVDAVAKTCTTDGNIEHWNCTVCNEKFEDQEATKSLKDVVVPASHEMNFVEGVRATCLENGNIEYWECTVTECGKFFVYNEAGELVEKAAEELVDEAKGHNFNSESWIAKKEANCTEEGLKGHYYCSLCENYLDSANKVVTKESLIIPIKNHEWSTNFVDGQDGKHYNYCTRDNCEVKNAESAKDHTWDNGTVTTAPKCTEEGIRTFRCTAEGCTATKTQAEPATGHTPGTPQIIEPNCIKEGYQDQIVCAVCGEVLETGKLLSALGHDWEKLEGHVDATCELGGKNNLRCKREGCDATDTEETEKLGHDMPEEWTVDQAADCLNAGTKSRICNNCKFYETETLQARGHDFVKIDDGKDATCKSEGNEAYKQCKACTLYFAINEPVNSNSGTKNPDDFNIEIDLTNHINVTHNDKVSATCSAKGTIEYWHCDDCNKNFSDEDCSFVADSLEIEKDSYNHVNTERRYEIPATCVKTGNEEGTYCLDCNKYCEGGKVISATNHKNKVHHEEIAATCVATGTIEYWSCPDCGKNFSNEACTTEVTDLTIQIDPNNHDLKTTTAKAPTCTEIGWNEYLTCQREGCRHSTYEENKLPATNHANKVHHEEIAATCVATGTIEYWSCPDCGKNFSNEACTTEVTDLTIQIDPNNHDLKTTTAKAPTCTEIGWDEYVTCQRSGCTYTTYVEKSALNHSWSTTFTKESDGKDGKHYQTCTRDNCEARNTSVAHVWDEGQITTNPLCLTEGVKTFTCSCNATYTQSVDATGHSFETAVAEKSATCVETGNYEYKHCSKCDKYFAGDALNDADNGEETSDSFVRAILNHSYTGDIKSNGNGKDAKHSYKCVNGCGGYGSAVKHTWNNGEITKNADCLNKGVKTYTCRVNGCGATYTEDIDAEGHKFGAITEAVEATCVAKGNKAYKKCSVCNKYFAADAATNDKTGKSDTISFVTKIDKDNHDWSDIKTVSTITNKTHYIECLRDGCDAEKSVDHVYTDYIIDVYSTCKTNGRQYRFCTACQTKFYEDLPLGDHIDKNKDNLCDVCKAVIQVTPPTPENPDDMPDEGGTKPACSCNCHASGLKGLLFDIILFFQRLFGQNRECICGEKHY